MELLRQQGTVPSQPLSSGQYIVAPQGGSTDACAWKDEVGFSGPMIEKLALHQIHLGRPLWCEGMADVTHDPTYTFPLAIASSVTIFWVMSKYLEGVISRLIKHLTLVEPDNHAFAWVLRIVPEASGRQAI